MKRERQIPITDHRSPITRANSTDEFAPGASEWPAGLSRREFLRLSSATLALAGLGACTKQSLEKIVPYVEQPEVVIPGNPLRFATATQYNGFGQGLLVTGYEGRPTKIEGNPTHPASLGATSVWAQADVLDLYDPDRAQTVTTGGGIKTLDDFWNALNLALESVKSAGGATLRILTEAISSRPTAQVNNDDWIEAVVHDLKANLGASIIIAGETQPLEVHALVSQINTKLGNNGVTISPVPPLALPANRIGFRELVDEMHGGEVELLIVLGGNPRYDAAADFDFAAAFEKVKLRVHHSVYFNETSRHSHWHIPALHFLESWSDTRAFDGSVSIAQPLIEPMYAGTSAHEILEALAGQSPRTSYEIVHTRWQTENPVPDFEAKWRRALSDGIVRELAAPSFPNHGESPALAASVSPPAEVQRTEVRRSRLELLFRPDVSVRDGRYANNGWLQELPRQFSKLVWDNAALIRPQLAKREELENDAIVDLTFRDRTIQAPVWIQPGQAENSVTMPLGYGREVAGRVGRNVGFNAYALRTADAFWSGDGLTIRKNGARHSFVSTQQHHDVHGPRGILHDGTFEEFVSNPHFAQEKENHPSIGETLYNPKEYPYKGYKWGMVVDLNVCIGCHACTIACQAENNIPVVGKQQVAVHREMHWIRVDTYYSGAADDPEFTHQPVPCMHCENAPCELVCPVGATVHDDEGLNLQVYNRCVGTRYCSNNCPYKVRRFNFLEYNNGLSPTEKLVKNPDVTVR